LSPPATRRRESSFKVPNGFYRQISWPLPNGGPIYSQSLRTPGGLIKGTQVTVSEGHPFKHQRGANQGDIGGDFFTQRNYVKGTSLVPQHMNLVVPNSGGYRRQYIYDGPILPCAPERLGFPGGLSLDTSRLDPIGATAVARCKPTNSVAELSTALGELYKDKLPALPGVPSWRTRTNVAKKAGNEFLGIQFGWLPLVSDVKNVIHGVKHADEILNQYVKDSGKVVRRSYDFPVQRSTTTVNYGQQVPYLIPDASDFYDFGNLGNMIGTHKTVTRRWFRGAFTYHIPSEVLGGGKMGEYANYAKKILGLDLSPEVLWNLAPWSWAIDWFSNTGDVISNLSDFATDGLVMRYGYVMEHTIQESTYTLTKTGLRAPVSVPPFVMVTETKIRRRANPFGFGTTWQGLSPRQLAITVALGLTRG